MYKIGIDIGGTSIKYGVFLNNLLIHKENVKHGINQYDMILKDIALKVKEYMEIFQITHDDLVGIGFGLPGPVKNKKSIHCVNIDIGTEDFLTDFINVLGFKTIIKIENDANVAALAEAINLKYSDSLLITIGTGIGCGIIQNYKIISGYNGAAGEIGHCKMENKYHFICGCKNVDCLETLSSATGICNIYKYKTKIKENITCEEIFDKALNHDLIAIETIDEAMEYLGKMLASVVNILDPQAIIIGGGVSNSKDFLLEKIKKTFYEGVFTSKDVKILISSLGADSGIYGAMWLVDYGNI